MNSGLMLSHADCFLKKKSKGHAFKYQLQKNPDVGSISLLTLIVELAPLIYCF